MLGRATSFMFWCLCVVCGYVHMRSEDDSRSPGAGGTGDCELWVLGTEAQSSERAVSALKP